MQNSKSTYPTTDMQAPSSSEEYISPYKPDGSPNHDWIWKPLKRPPLNSPSGHYAQCCNCESVYNIKEIICPACKEHNNTTHVEGCIVQEWCAPAREWYPGPDKWNHPSGGGQSGGYVKCGVQECGAYRGPLKLSTCTACYATDETGRRERVREWDHENQRWGTEILTRLQWREKYKKADGTYLKEPPPPPTRQYEIPGVPYYEYSIVNGRRI
jgi:hypothetical protein